MPSSFPERLRHTITMRWQMAMDRLVPQLGLRWLVLAVLVASYCYRVYSIQGFYIVTYGLGIFLLNLMIGFLTPIDDQDHDGPMLPSNTGDEFKPFVRRLPEYKFWYSCAKAIIIGFLMTFFRVFDVPVFWPILLVYFLVLFVLTMKRQIKHMIKYRYLPCSCGKKKYKGKSKKTSIAEDIRAK